MNGQKFNLLHFAENIVLIIDDLIEAKQILQDFQDSVHRYVYQ